MWKYFIRLFSCSKAHDEALNKWANRFSRIELEAENLKHKIQTLQRLPRYKQATQENAQKLTLYQAQLQQIEGDAIFTNFCRNNRRDLVQKQHFRDVIADWPRFDKAKRVHSRWHVEMFRFNWATFPDWHFRISLFRKLFRIMKWHLVFSFKVAYGRVPFRLMRAFVRLKLLLTFLRLLLR